MSYAYVIVDDVEKRFAVFWEAPQIGPNKFGICWTTVDMNDAKTEEETQEKKDLYERNIPSFFTQIFA